MIKEPTIAFLLNMGIAPEAAEAVRDVFMAFVRGNPGIHPGKVQVAFNSMGPGIYMEATMPCRICGGANGPGRGVTAWVFEGKDAEALGLAENRARIVWVSLCQTCFRSGDCKELVLAYAAAQVQAGKYQGLYVGRERDS